jgi:hypothetical protein
MQFVSFCQRALAPGILAVSLLLAGCDSDGDEAGQTAAGGGVAAEVKAEAKEAVEAIRDKDSKREKKDRGEASMNIGGVAWTGDSAKARSRGTSLTIKASHTDAGPDGVQRQEVHLQIDDFKGPGDYTTGIGGSQFIAVGMDTKKIKEAEKTDAKAGTDAATTQLLGDVLGESSMILLMQAKVHVDGATATEISGSFSWEPRPNSKDPAITDGKFRAVIPPKK